jgi:peptidoglycan/xylan/chitin deacetylase (PgdA/CDA1 family)
MNLRPTLVSFDDGLLEGLKWARTMAQLGLQGTFYICPGLLGGEFIRPGQWCLTEAQVEQIVGWGHIIANHTWAHEAPASHVHIVVLDSIHRTEAWLEKRGYDGKRLALTFGSEGGRWDGNFVETLLQEGYGVRDFTEGQESTELPSKGLRTFHGNHSTSDEAFAKFIYSLAEAVESGGQPSPDPTHPLAV